MRKRVLIGMAGLVLASGVVFFSLVRDPGAARAEADTFDPAEHFPAQCLASLRVHGVKELRQKLKNEPELIRRVAEQLPSAPPSSSADPPAPIPDPEVPPSTGESVESPAADGDVVPSWLEALRNDLKEVIALLA